MTAPFLRHPFSRWICLVPLFVICLAVFPEGRSLADTGSDVRHDLTVRLLPGKSRIEATDRVFIAKPGKQVVFSLAPGAHITGVTLSRLAAEGSNASGDSGGAARKSIPGSRAGKRHLKRPFVAPFSFADGRIKVSVPEKYRRGALQAVILYDLSFRKSAPENPVGNEDPTYGITGIVSPKGVFLLPEAGWIPEPTGQNPAYRVEILAPKGFEAITAGWREIREETLSGTRSVWHVDQPVRGLQLSAGPYVVREAAFGDIPVHTYFFADSDSLAPDYLDASVRYLELYTGLLGPYPFPKFAEVENFFPTGYGFPSYTLLGGTVIRLPFIIGSSLGHEVAHSWFGNGVFADPRSGNWSEGLVTYIADHLYKERESEAEAKEYRLQILRNYASLVPPEKDFPLSTFTGRSDPVTRVVGYGKAAMVFHMARRRVGDDAFWRGLRSVVREKLFQNATWSDLFQAFGMNPDRDIAPFEAEWLLRPGAPVLGITDVRMETDGAEFRVSGVITQREPVYRTLHVPVRVEAEGGEVVDLQVPGGNAEAFEVRTKGRPLRVLVDPEVDCFRRLAPGETPPTVNSVRGSDSLLVILASGLAPESRNAAMELLTAVGREDAPVLEEREATPERLAGRDLLLIGLPERPGLVPDPPPGVSLEGGNVGLPGEVAELSSDTKHEEGPAAQAAKTPETDLNEPKPPGAPSGGTSFSINGMRFSDPGDALFMVFPREKVEQETSPDPDAGASSQAETPPGEPVTPKGAEGARSRLETPSPPTLDTPAAQRTVALFLPLSADAARAAARKIPHYGKQSLLVFSAGANRVKSTWPAEGLVREFPR